MFVVEIPREPGQQRDCWWRASLRRHVDSSNGYIRQARSLYLVRTDFNQVCPFRQCLQILETNVMYFSVFKK